MKIAVTGAMGLLGWHASARIHAMACAARFREETPEHDLIQIDRATFEDPQTLSQSLAGVDAVLHFAGVNRGEPDAVEVANPAIANALTLACEDAGIRPHIVYANSTHASQDSPYGRSKRKAGEILCDGAESFTDLILPHIFGETAKPHYNNVTATLIDQLWKGEEPTLNPNGRVQLLHAGEAAQLALDAVLTRQTGTIAPIGRDMAVSELYEKLRGFHALYQSNCMPDVSDPFDLALFNTYRTAAYPDHHPATLEVKEDQRGKLFESAKGEGQCHTFLSTTHPGKTRGDHFHTDLVERFLVVKGEAVIRMRKVLTEEVHEFRVSGDQPVAIDQLPLHTHHIENVGDEEVITFFWSHRIFDPASPDTFADPV